MVCRFFSFSTFLLAFIAISTNSQAYTQLSIAHYCDQEREVVQGRKAAHSKGKILSEDNAKRIKA